MSKYMEKANRADWDIKDDISYHEEQARLASDVGEILDELEVVQAYEEIDAIRAEKKQRKVDTVIKVLGGIGTAVFLGALNVVAYMFETDNISTRKGIPTSIRNTMSDIGFRRK